MKNASIDKMFEEVRKTQAEIDKICEFFEQIPQSKFMRLNGALARLRKFKEFVDLWSTYESRIQLVINAINKHGVKKIAIAFKITKELGWDDTLSWTDDLKEL